MTFYEAAIEILRAAGRPLHYKKITEISIKRGLLSHVGKTPELTMSTRLNQEIRKDDGTALVICTRPGVFALRAWQDDTVADRVAETVNLEPDADPTEATATEEEDASPPLPPAERRRLRRRRRRQVEQERRAQTEPALDDDGPEASEEGADEAPIEEAPTQETRADAPPALPPRRRLADSPLGRQEELHTLIAELRADAEANVARRLHQLSMGGLVTLTQALLERTGHTQVRLERSDAHTSLLTAQARAGLGQQTALIALRLGGEAIGVDGVEALREALLELGAHQATLIAFGGATQEAIEESTAIGQIPILVLNAPLFAQQLVEHRIGVLIHPIQIVQADDGFFESLET